jgi:hypothetical protein
MEAERASDKYSQRVDIALGRSRLVEAFVVAGTLATLALLWAIPWDIEARALGVGWTGVCALHALRRVRAVRSLALDRWGEVVVDGASGQVRDGSFVAPWLVSLRWRPAGARFDRTLLVAPDMLGRDEFRRLRVLLKLGDSGRSSNLG